MNVGIKEVTDFLEPDKEHDVTEFVGNFKYRKDNSINLYGQSITKGNTKSFHRTKVSATKWGKIDEHVKTKFPDIHKKYLTKHLS